MPYRIDAKKGLFFLWNINKKKYVEIPFKSRQTAINAGKNYIRFREKTKSKVVGNKILPIQYMINEPKNKELYLKVKKEIYKKYPKHSAYRSGLLVKEYKSRGGEYTGKKNKDGLTRWFKEEWTNQRGTTGYKKKSDVYRPTKRITKDTPKTFKELSKKEISVAQKKKLKKGRVDKF